MMKAWLISGGALSAATAAAWVAAVAVTMDDRERESDDDLFDPLPTRIRRGLTTLVWPSLGSTPS